MGIEAVLLDLGNVVLELDFRRMLDAIGLPAPSSEDAAMKGLDQIPIFDRFERGQVTDAEFFRAFGPQLTSPLTFPAFETGWNEIFVGEVAGIDETLRKIARRIPLYALTNVNALHMKRIVKFPALRHFKKIFTSFEFHCRKPEPEIFLKSAEQMGVAVEDILFLDDRPENVDGARKLGMPAELVAHSATDLLAHLRRHGIVVE